MILRGNGVPLAAIAALALAGCSDMFGDKTPDPAPSASVAALASLPAAPPPPEPATTPTPTSASAAAVTLDFGDDNGKYARDGECDDKRFAGAGMTDTPLLDSDVRHDATDCRTAFDQRRLTYEGENSGNSRKTGYAASGVDHIMWGDDNGKFAKDGECDDKRFVGAGMTETPLIDSDIKHDATDCRVAFEQGRLQLRE